MAKYFEIKATKENLIKEIKQKEKELMIMKIEYDSATDEAERRKIKRVVDWLEIAVKANYLMYECQEKGFPDVKFEIIFKKEGGNN